MKSFRTLLVLTLLVLCTTPAYADCVCQTGNSAIIVLPKDVASGLKTGDVITARSGTMCIGQTVYQEGKALSITVWGDDAITPGIDGATAGALIEFSIYRPSTNATVDQVIVAYSSGDGLYATNDIEIVQVFAPDGTLPVELGTLLALVDGTDAVLRWQTMSETNNAGFEVQRLTEDGAYAPMAFIEGKGTAAKAQRYEYKVAALAPGTHHFRLKQLDFDGAFVYSPEVEVQIEMPDGFFLSEAYPNPFNPETSMTLAVRETEKVEIKVYDVQGRLVQTLFRGEVEANKTMPVHFTGNTLASGLYLIRAKGESFNATRKVTLIK